MEITKELLEICKIVHERNELQRARHTARRKVRTLGNVRSYKDSLKRYKEEVRFADESTNFELKALTKMSKIRVSKFSHTLYGIHLEISNACSRLKREIAEAKTKLRQAPYRDKGISNKMLKLKPRQLMILQKEWSVKQTQAELQLHYHSDKYSKRLRQLLAGSEWRMYTGQSNIVTLHKKGMQTAGSTYLNQERISEIALTLILEDAIKAN